MIIGTVPATAAWYHHPLLSTMRPIPSYSTPVPPQYRAAHSTIHCLSTATIRDLSTTRPTAPDATSVSRIA
eukprot:3659166-Rhodomonas_salina.1